MLGPFGMLAHAVSEHIAARAKNPGIFAIIAPLIDAAQERPEATRPGNF